MRRLLKEPLLHFLVLGAALFMAYSLMQKNGSGSEPMQIVVTMGQVEQMAMVLPQATGKNLLKLHSVPKSQYS